MKQHVTVTLSPRAPGTACRQILVEDAGGQVTNFGISHLHDNDQLVLSLIRDDQDKFAAVLVKIDGSALICIDLGLPGDSNAVRSVKK